METQKFIAKCLAAVPCTETWHGAGMEPYGVTSSFKHWPAEIKKILFCVTGSAEVDAYARANGYDAIVAHHPLHTGNSFPTMTFHTALDCCKGGLNDMWAEALGVTKDKHIDENLGWVGRFNRPMTFGTLLAKVEKFIGSRILGKHESKIGFSHQIETVAICTGMGGSITNLVEPHKADCYITGELTHSRYDFPAVIETGHTLSERMGQKFFEKLLAADGVQVDLCPLDIDVFGTECSTMKEKEIARRYEASATGWQAVSGQAIETQTASNKKLDSQRRWK